MNKVSYGERIPGKEKYSSLEAHVEAECEPGLEAVTLANAKRVVRDILAVDPPSAPPEPPKVVPPPKLLEWAQGRKFRRRDRPDLFSTWTCLLGPGPGEKSIANDAGVVYSWTEFDGFHPRDWEVIE